MEELVHLGSDLHLEYKPISKKGTQIATLLANADLLERTNETELSFALLLKALKMDSYHPEVLKRAARYNTKKMNYGNAVRILQELVKTDYNFMTVFQLAEAYYANGNDAQAVQKYEEAINVALDANPKLFDAYKNLGNLYCRQGDYLAAEEQYFKAFTVNPSSDVLLVNLGTLEIQRDDFLKAQEKFKAALEINPRNDKAWVGLGFVFEKLGELDLAIANLENALEIDAANRTAVHVYAAWCVRANNLNPAIEAIQNFLAEVEYDEEMSLLLTHLFCLKGESGFALLEIERILCWNPSHENALQIYNQLLEKL